MALTTWDAPGTTWDQTGSTWWSFPDGDVVPTAGVMRPGTRRVAQMTPALVGAAGMGPGVVRLGYDAALDYDDPWTYDGAPTGGARMRGAGS